MLEVNQLVAGYAGIVALRSVSLSVAKGAMVCLVGANGAGKSTLLNTISGLVAARGGSVRFDGADITRRPAQAIARQGDLAAGAGRTTDFRRACSGRGREFGGGRPQRRRRPAGRCRSRSRAHLRAISDSEGTPAPDRRAAQRRPATRCLRSGYAPLMEGRPRLLLLDEPSLGLGPAIVNQVYAALRQLNDAGLSILVVEQNARRAMEVTDYTYVLDRGTIVLEGPSAQVSRGRRRRRALSGSSRTRHGVARLNGGAQITGRRRCVS